MQPNYLAVVGKPSKSFPEKSIQRIDKVQAEQYDWNYVGYNFDGKKLFEYHWRSVNVHYFTD